MLFIVYVIAIIVVLALVFLLTRFLPKVVREIILAVLAVFVITMGVWMLVDANDLRQHFYQDEKLFLLDIDGKIEGGFTLAKSSEIPATIKDLSEIREEYPDLGKIQGSYYKVIVMKWDLVDDNVVLDNFEALSSEIKTALLSDSPKELFVDKTAAKLGETARGIAMMTADALYPTEDSFRSAMFALLAAKPLSEQETMFRAVRQGTAIVHPETITFKIIKILPESTTKWFVPKE